eukprot:Skav201072  [mRNA]  locus=scaffold963:66690:68819:+ [translate_table: standard]
MAGNAAPPNAREATDAFLRRHPGINLYQVLGVEPGAAPNLVLKAYRMKCVQVHPDKFPDPGDKAKKTEEFQILSTAKDILHDPIMAFYYREWLARNEVAEQLRGRGSERPRPTQSRWPPPSTAAGAASSSSRPRPSTDPKSRQHFEETRARFGRPAKKAPPPPSTAAPPPFHDPWNEPSGRPAEKAPPPKQARAPRAPAYDPWAENEDEPPPKPTAKGPPKPRTSLKGYDPRASEDERAHAPPQKRMPSSSPGAPPGGRPKKAAPPRDVPPAEGPARGHKPPPPRDSPKTSMGESAQGFKAPPPPQSQMFARGSVGRVQQKAAEATGPGAASTGGYQRPPPARPMAPPSMKRTRSPQSYRGEAVGRTEDLRAPRVPLGDASEMEVDEDDHEAAATTPMDTSEPEVNPLGESWAEPAPTPWTEPMEDSWAEPAAASWADVPTNQWETPADPADDQSFVYVNVDTEGSDFDSWVTEESDYIYDEPDEWQDEEEASAFQQREEQAARSEYFLLEQLFKKRAPPAIGLPPQSFPMTPEFREGHLAGDVGGYHMSSTAQQWLNKREGVPPHLAKDPMVTAQKAPPPQLPKRQPPLPEPTGPPRVWGTHRPPSSSTSSCREGRGSPETEAKCPSTTRTCPLFLETGLPKLRHGRSSRPSNRTSSQGSNTRASTACDQSCSSRGRTGSGNAQVHGTNQQRSGDHRAIRERCDCHNW